MYTKNTSFKVTDLKLQIINQIKFTWGVIAKLPRGSPIRISVPWEKNDFNNWDRNKSLFYNMILILIIYFAFDDKIHNEETRLYLQASRLKTLQRWQTIFGSVNNRYIIKCDISHLMFLILCFKLFLSIMKATQPAV